MLCASAVTLAAALVPNRRAVSVLGWADDPGLEVSLPRGCDLQRVPANAPMTAPETPTLVVDSPALQALAAATPSPAAAAGLLRRGRAVKVRQRVGDWVEGETSETDFRFVDVAEAVESLSAGRRASSLHFSSGHGALLEALFSSADWPPPALADSFSWADRNSLVTAVGAFGGTGAGSAAHDHAETYFALVHGKKWWALWPPGALESTPPDIVEKHLWPWNIPGVEVADAIRKGRVPAPLVCLQRAGEVLRLPDWWFHATVNVGRTFGIAQQRPRGRLPPASLASLHPNSYRAARLLARTNPGEAARMLRRLCSSADWVLVAPGVLRDWAGSAGASLRDEVRPVMLRLSAKLSARLQEGAVNPAQHAKEHRMWASELMALAERDQAECVWVCPLAELLLAEALRGAGRHDVWALCLLAQSRILRGDRAAAQTAVARARRAAARVTDPRAAAAFKDAVEAVSSALTGLIA
eukprot:TRINITY_DN13287_c0_g1_i1.p1 TRINITY_DN13287_c0_g1~~TRINITY_DN13287_c0_g1_i1.p1  ORF type:complete len:470 (+),score=74.89 TRINITY_DN13287_c0_g1_i1:50-1459(+)